MTSPESGIPYIKFLALRIRIHLKKWNPNTFVQFCCLESIYGPGYEYISFLAPEYKYIYPLGKVNMGPNYIETNY